jgi:hypothetical protein
MRFKLSVGRCPDIISLAESMLERKSKCHLQKREMSLWNQDPS